MNRLKGIFPFAALIFWGLTIAAAAHPLGNFSVNNYSRLEIEAGQIRVRCVVDLAEIPTFQESSRINTDQNWELSEAELAAYAAAVTPEYQKNLRLTVDGQPLAFAETGREIYLEKGAGDLSVLKIKWIFAAPLPAGNAARRVSFENRNHAERVGWNEIVVTRQPGIEIFDSTAFADGVTDELKEYPENLLNAPLAERAAEFSVAANVPADARPLRNRDGKIPPAPAPKDDLAALIAVKEITPAIVLLGLLIAFGLGAAHALSPGHGKAVVGAYLVGSRGTPRHAAFLGLTVTLTHTLGVFALGLVTVFAAGFVLPEKLLPYLNFVSGLLVLFIGLMLFKNRLFALLGWQAKAHEHAPDDVPDADNNFTHTHGGTTHSHAPPEAVTWRNLFALGVSGGLLPCPSALVLMLAAISQNRVGYGFLLTLAFSAGLAATLTVIGLAFLSFGKVFERRELAGNQFVKLLPVLSAFVVACLGAVICWQSLA